MRPVLRLALFLTSGCTILVMLSARAQGISDPVKAAASPKTTTSIPSPVTVQTAGGIYTLSNGILAARIEQRTGRVVSLSYRGVNVLDRQGGYWSHSAASAHTVSAITIDRQRNGGQRAEVSIKGTCDGKPLERRSAGGVIADIEIRYALSRGGSGLYAYCIFDHPARYPATSIGEARFCAKLRDDLFDWITVDAERNRLAITAYDWNHGERLNLKEARRLTTGIYKGEVAHKYDLSAVQFDTPAFGWSSTTRHIGCWFINPSMEYLSGGPTKVELCAHFHKDWNYCQCPRLDRPKGTPWTIRFQMPDAPGNGNAAREDGARDAKGPIHKKATLRLAFAATSARRVDVSVNGTAAGSTGPLRDTATIRRDGIRGYWYERDVTFDAGLLRPGENQVTLTIPPGNPMNGVEYDYLRLESR